MRNLVEIAQRVFISLVKRLFKKTLKPISQLPMSAKGTLFLALGLSFSMAHSFTSNKNEAHINLAPVMSGNKSYAVTLDGSWNDFRDTAIEDFIQEDSNNKVRDNNRILKGDGNNNVVQGDDNVVANGDGSTAVGRDYIISGGAVSNILYHTEVALQLAQDILNNRVDNSSLKYSAEYILSSVDSIQASIREVNLTSGLSDLSSDCSLDIVQKTVFGKLPSGVLAAVPQTGRNSLRSTSTGLSEEGQTQDSGPSNRSRGWNECGKGDYPIPCQQLHTPTKDESIVSSHL